ncbi:MAG: aldehyde dehydrogenase family protein [Porticoccaceae bacterium]|nr:aldehyde dehydrogenase family protein [Porticoccaceae bacterium]
MTQAQLDVLSPYSGEVLGSLPTTTSGDIEHSLSSAYQLFRSRRNWLPLARRIEILQKTARIMAERAEALALQAAQEGGKPLVDSRVEVARAIDGIHCCIDSLRSEGGEVVPMNLDTASSGRLAMTTREPVGVVVAVSAFNHPLNLIVHQVAPAVAAGCPVIVKPAQDTPLSCLSFVEILHEAGLPEDWCQALVIDDLSVAEQLVTDPRVGFFSFIGSAAVGWTLRSKLAPGVRCALEHGGVAPVLVLEDADLDRAVALLAKGSFYHAGQVCVSVQRIFAHQDIAEELARRLTATASQLIVGDPALDTTDIGPLIRPAEQLRVSSWIEEAVEAGTSVLRGGESLDNNCYQPTVLLDPPANCKVSNHEIFGPVVSVFPYSDIDHALSLANGLDSAFQSAVFTQNIDQAAYVYRHIDASAVMINDHSAFRTDWMPFAGLRQSGLGVGGIPHTLREMQIDKMLVLNSPVLGGL